MSELNLILQVEALIFASQQPLNTLDIITFLSNALERNINGAEIDESIQQIKKKYDQDIFSFELKESGGGFQFLTKKKYHSLVLQLNGDKYIKKLSTSAMETLSIIAYKQPVTKMDIELIRGVSSDYSVQKLLEKELIYISGRKEEAIGKPLLYCTTKHFMDYLGINSSADLPQMKEIITTNAQAPNLGTDAQPVIKQELFE